MDDACLYCGKRVQISHCFFTMPPVASHDPRTRGYFSFCCCCFVFLVIRLFRGESFLYRLTMRKSFIQLQEVEVENNNNEKKNRSFENGYAQSSATSMDAKERKKNKLRKVLVLREKCTRISFLLSESESSQWNAKKLATCHLVRVIHAHLAHLFSVLAKREWCQAAIEITGPSLARDSRKTARIFSSRITRHTGRCVYRLYASSGA